MTAHIESKKEDIKKIVLMPGDPKRCKHIAENFLENYRLINSVRGMLAYTGTYKGKEVTIFPSGMGIPSIAIYAYELFKFYEVDEIIRIGTVGTIKKDVNLFDLILVDKSITDSNFATSFAGEDTHVVTTSPSLNEKILKVAKDKSMKLHFKNIFCTEAFYQYNNYLNPLIEEYNCYGYEMESFALSYIANKLNKKATTLLTVSNSLVTNEETSSLEREKHVDEMIILSLESIL